MTVSRQLEGAARFCEMQMAQHRSTLSGSGSTLPNTRAVRRWLRDVIERYDVDSILDAPCGDGRWMADVQFSGFYRGLDCEEKAVVSAAARMPSRDFECQDLLGYTTHLKWDLILSRDFFVHLSLANGARVLESFQNGNLLALTHFPHVTKNEELVETHPGWGWRPLNMTIAPFHLPAPIEVCEEDEGQGKTLALFKL